jgi:hypothetical protein
MTIPESDSLERAEEMPEDEFEDSFPEEDLAVQLAPGPQPEDEADEPEPEEAMPFFSVGLERLEQLDRSAIHLIAGRLAPDSPFRSQLESGLTDPQVLVDEIAEHHADEPGFIRSEMPIQEIVFRTLLATGNKPMSLRDIHYELTERWATPVRPIVITQRRLLRVMDADTYYGFVRSSDPES